ncbi:phage tail protein [Candidatus Binatus sp.]|uniref:phage tail protein n=1 Tax=Candidatus Binatus sp. TaxID=2811406 RepID=UPI003C812671
MFAALGDIQFEVVGSPEAYESAGAYDFAEQKVLDSKPQLQWVGDDLERLNFELTWHASFTNPATQLALLRASAAEHLALPLVFGNGSLRGFFVIESIKVKSQQLSASGTPIAIRVALALKEWIADSLLLSSALTANAVSPIGITTASQQSGSGANGLTPGVSVLLSTQPATGASGPNLEADDVPAAAIVRSVAR